ncbi:Utp14-domain-containing protein [Cristinia sonorae]|uniref:Utp14-domain-containing protein n=1 Tax=Cristinia sonorae TaxID=1940300 RepID=A0A8K0ULR1_9AGAR|nr:Utp14-domain-containing protein [Cristinia sonorae]
MVRPVKSSTARKPKTQFGDRKTFNANGYAKRQSLKAKKTTDSDVYEYRPEKERRGKVKLLLEKDELLGARGDSDDEDEEGSGRGKGKGRNNGPRLVGEDEDDMEIGEDEDEEIDSDGAFDESDEDRYAGFSFASVKNKPKPKVRSNKKATAAPTKGVRFAEVDLNEDDKEDELQGHESDASQADGGDDGSEEEEEEEEEGEPDEFIDVLDIMDGKGEAMSDDDDTVKLTKKTGDTQPEDIQDDEASEDGSEEEESEEEGEEPSAIISASEDEDEEAITKMDSLKTFITSLDAGQKRKLPEDEDSSHPSAVESRPQKRRVLQERAESGIENEFATHTGATKLNLDDLLAPLASTSASSDLQSLKKSAKILTSTSKTKTLSAPLPTRTQERLDREAAYEQTKEEVDKWNATMKRIKEAEHLSFPLQAPTTEKTSSLQLAAKFKPTTEMESAVDKLMKAANLRGEKDIAQTETLKMNHLTVEEVAARRAELAQNRELMFRAEAKAKRIAKIKSKTYRRLRKKEKAKLAEKLGEGDENPEDLDEEGRLKMEVQRARERATLKHKNAGKWAKAMKHRGELDEDQRRDISEMLDRGEKLRRRIRGEESGDDSEGDEDDDSEEDEDAIKAKAFDELTALQREDGSIPEGKKGKSVFDMKFMKDAMARDRQRANQMVDDFVKELGGISHEGGEDDVMQSVDHEAQIERVGGRVVYRPGALSGQLRPNTSLASDTSSVTLRSTDFPSDGAQPNSAAASLSPVSLRSDRPLPTLLEEAPNPWLVPRGDVDDVSVKAVQKKHEVAVSKNSATAEKSKNKLRKKKQSLEAERAKAKEDAVVDVEMADVMTLASGSKSSSAAGPSLAGPTKDNKKATKASTKGKTVASATQQDNSDSDSDDSDANSELDEQEKAVDSKLKGKARAVKAFEQRDLVARAFAGDNVVQQFAEAKRLEMQQDAPKEVDTTLPGWGSWGGTGTKKLAPKPHLIKKIAGVDPKSRADFNKSHVIISEKRDKKAAKYLVKDLPFPYTSKAQFERSMGTPVGTEWNTRIGFQRGTLPRVVTKPGTIISPLEKLL